jgi:N-acetylmuramoyl-L-alanine amidase
MFKYLLSALLVFPMLFAATTVEAGRPYTPPVLIPLAVTLDPGHGGSDPGAVYNGLKESGVNLDIAYRLKALLEDAGYTVNMTRTDDSTKSNNDRYTFANSVDAAILVSIHLNASSDHSVNGTQGFYGKPRKDKEATDFVHQALANTLGVPDRGVTNFASGVLLKTKYASTLQETVFISNDAENARLQDRTGNRQQEIAQALFNGIDDWFRRPMN